MYTIDENAVKELELYLQEIPFKYANSILQLLNGKLTKLEEPKTKADDKK